MIDWADKDRAVVRCRVGRAKARRHLLKKSDLLNFQIFENFGSGSWRSKGSLETRKAPVFPQLSLPDYERRGVQAECTSCDEEFGR